jgi:hypothetical protein
VTADELAALRARACGLVSALGSLLDSLELVGQIDANPSDPFSDALISAQHLEEAAATADTLAQAATDLATAIDALQVRHRAQALKLEAEGSP